MRKWLLAASCTALFIAGCSDPANLQQSATQLAVTQDQTGRNTDEASSVLPSTQPLVQSDAIDVDNSADLTAATPELTSSIRVPQLDGTVIDVRGLFIPNESIGYYLYLLPGFRVDLDLASGTFTLTAADNDTQAIIEALPPQIDMQLAADELRTAMERLDENMLQITEYMRQEFWADATIYRAYAGDERVTTILKSVHNIPLRITVTEPSDAQELHQIMAMITTIRKADTETWATLNELNEPSVSHLLGQAYELQTNILQAYAVEADASDAGNLSELDDHERSTATWLTLTMDTFVQSTDDVIAYLEAFYSSEVAEQVIADMGLALHNGELRAQLPDEGSPMLWDQATLELISESENERRYLARVPVGAEDAGASKLQELRLRRTALGWRIHTPLTILAKLPVIGE